MIQTNQSITTSVRSIQGHQAAPGRLCSTSSKTLQNSYYFLPDHYWICWDPMDQIIGALGKQTDWGKIWLPWHIDDDCGWVSHATSLDSLHQCPSACSAQAIASCRHKHQFAPWMLILYVLAHSECLGPFGGPLQFILNIFLIPIPKIENIQNLLYMKTLF